MTYNLGWRKAHFSPKRHSPFFAQCLHICACSPLSPEAVNAQSEWTHTLFLAVWMLSRTGSRTSLMAMSPPQKLQTPALLASIRSVTPPPLSMK
jgi:hypothetical protein